MEIKIMYKKCDESQFEERDNELAKVKEEMEQKKATKVNEAKAKMTELKKQLNVEKQAKLKSLK